MSDKKFFEKQTRSSKIKALIVSTYFPKYSNIIGRKGMQTKIRYVDLFAGPGIYEDGNYSTPILIGQACQKTEMLRNTVEMIFNDNIYGKVLRENFTKIFPINTFNYQPSFGSRTVGEDVRITNYLRDKTKTPEGKNPNPTLLFIDPFGYKGVDTLSLAEFLQNWGNEIFLFVNIKRIHAAIENEKFDDLMHELFPKNFEKLKHDRRYQLTVDDRLQLIIENLGDEYRQVLPEEEPLYFTPFRFKEEDNDATSHYILHFTKHAKGFELVKQTYHDFDNIGAFLQKNGTYAFDAKKLDNEIVTVSFDFGDPNIDLLSEILKKHYSGQSLKAEKLFMDHQPTTNFSRTHYTQALRNLAEKGELTAIFTDTINHEVSVLISPYCELKFN
jgi:three-Cys-motif partner protein